MRLLEDDEVDRLYVEVPQGIKRRSTNMSSLLCGTLCSTIVFSCFDFYLMHFVSAAETRAECWWFGGRVIPDPIPNSAVKPPSGDGTYRHRWGE